MTVPIAGIKWSDNRIMSRKGDLSGSTFQVTEQLIQQNRLDIVYEVVPQTPRSWFERITSVYRDNFGANLPQPLLDLLSATDTSNATAKSNDTASSTTAGMSTGTSIELQLIERRQGLTEIEKLESKQLLKLERSC